jgi:hypothetical protein
LINKGYILSKKKKGAAHPDRILGFILVIRSIFDCLDPLNASHNIYYDCQPAAQSTYLAVYEISKFY